MCFPLSFLVDAAAKSAQRCSAGKLISSVPSKSIETPHTVISSYK